MNDTNPTPDEGQPMTREQHLRAAIQFAEGKRSWWNLHAPNCAEGASAAHANCAQHDLAAAQLHLVAAQAMGMLDE